eukprot:TRINITY_DN28498_c0_g1_i1.p1 TRINITY_DN28498_c0_g1~~TRINITY_DN28498_c0_g1_i1.p1  ORF type:complete len:314 (+),score=122.40 TRINITY_DN28498_c0_g1_i1:49-990(+)
MGATPEKGAEGKMDLQLAGLMFTPLYRTCWEAGSYLASRRADDVNFEELQMVPTDYEKWKAKAGEEVGKVLQPCVVVDAVSGRCWGGEDFVDFARKVAGFKVFNVAEDDPESYASLAQRTYRSFLKSTGDLYAWMDIAIDGQAAKRVIFQLYAKTCPKTVENFRQLCNGTKQNQLQNPKAPQNAKNLHYKGTTLFRIVKDGWIQGGDVSNPGTMKAGNGGESIYGEEFPNESFDVPHIEEGVLGMANSGPHSNASQFYITVSRNQWMDRRYVAFGRVIEGIQHIRDIHALEVRPNQAPAVPITIEDCGSLDIE